MKRLTLCALALLVAAGAVFAGGNVEFVTIGTGGVTIPTGGAISRMVNAKQDVYNVKATVESTGGSVFNINAVLSGDLEFGIAQSDIQYQAFNGEGKWSDTGAQDKLRAVFSIHPESITLVVSEASGIKSIADIKGKRINLGNQGSGNLENAKQVLAAVGLSESDVQAEYIKAVESAGLMQDERIDGFFYTVGHPNGSVKEATSGRLKVRIADIAGPGIDNMVKANSYLAKSVIAKDFYPQSANSGDTKTLGVKATLVTSADVDDDIVYAITKEVFDNFDDFKKLHPAYAVLTKESMLSGLSAPIHPGALRYYDEAGLTQHINPSLIQ